MLLHITWQAAEKPRLKRYCKRNFAQVGCRRKERREPQEESNSSEVGGVFGQDILHEFQYIEIDFEHKQLALGSD